MRVAAIAGALLTVSALTGCGGGSGSSGAGAGAGAGRQVIATETEFHIALSRASFTPGTYTFVAKNDGSILHALAITGPGVADRATGDIGPGQSASLRVTLRRGRYDVFCPVGDHKMEGMDTHIQVS